VPIEEEEEDICNNIIITKLVYNIRAIKEQDKNSITSAEMNFIRITAKYTWQGYKTQ
jgi:hypothetical protein